VGPPIFQNFSLLIIITSRLTEKPENSGEQRQASVRYRLCVRTDMVNSGLKGTRRFISIG